jgi:glycosyltransferase involved in cell wall biosynthesis
VPDEGGDSNDSRGPDRGSDVRVHIASINTARVTELTVRTMHHFAGAPFTLVVGDGGSTDGSLEMLRKLEAEGWLTLEVAPEGRTHAAWLDKWFAECPARYAVFADSDVEFLRPGWLRDMLDAAHRSGAALVATRIQARGGTAYRHPATGVERILAERPEPWLMMIDVEQTRGVLDTGFAYRDETRPDGTKVGYDTSAAFFRDLQAAGMTYVEMPESFAHAYHHYGSMSWQRTGDRRMPIARRAKQAAKHARAFLAIYRARLRCRTPVSA